MPWRQHGRAKVNPRSPDAFGTCDRCGFWYNLKNLRFQYDWRGNTLANLYVRVCPRCYDKPFQHYRPIIVPPDPVPKYMPRPDLYAPLMPYLLTDPLGRTLLDPKGEAVLAPGEIVIPQLNNAPTPRTGYSSAQQADGYRLTAPTGGPVIPIPED